jgi:hypothetical protein
MNSDNDLPTDSHDEKITPVEAIAQDTKVTEPALTQVLAEPNKESSAGTVVLQWLTYAFWGWLIVGVAYLVSITATFTLAGEQLGTDILTPIAYGIAAVLVLLPVALLCDIFYSQQEVERKKGASSVVMIIHAVLFALFGIGTLITIAFSLVNMILSGYHSSAQAVLITACVMFVLYFLVLVRTVKPFMAKKLRLIFWIVMAVVVIGACTWGIVGPAAAAARTKEDRDVSQALTSVNGAIASYTSSKQKLPKDIEAAIKAQGVYEGSDEATIRDLVKKNLISYTPNIPGPTTTELDDIFAPNSPTSKTYYYELCGTYKFDGRGDSYGGRSYPSTESDGFTSYLDVSSHTGGKNCYKLKASSYIGL